MTNVMYDNCLDCPYHQVISDPDPDDWFCDDDQAVVCTQAANPKRQLSSRYAADLSPYRVVMPAIRPYNLRKEAVTPSWCPLQQPKQLEGG
ncbi:MAG: hypothetical protein KC877_05150 [Candidatus Kaiserbacteria bacterium]|nr:hypothetical protein [Candidatus Kaiserbacteria bacterium]MCB9816543.1 hypothetical protein [Candidatus Nomurabacteria bacterium]